MGKTPRSISAVWRIAEAESADAEAASHAPRTRKGPTLERLLDAILGPLTRKVVRLRAHLEELEPFEEMLKAIGRTEKVIVLLLELTNAREETFPQPNLALLRNAAQEALSGVESVTGKLILPSH